MLPEHSAIHTIAKNTIAKDPVTKNPVADRPSTDRFTELGHIFSITLRVRDRQPVFSDAVYTRHCVDFLRALATMTGTRVYAYCLMPDHVHLLLGASPATSVPRFVGRWKSLCAREWRRRTGRDSFWRRNFRDRVLPTDEDPLRAGSHILMNPLRAGLAQTPDQYAFSGSLVWDLD